MALSIFYKLVWDCDPSWNELEGNYEPNTSLGFAADLPFNGWHRYPSPLCWQGRWGWKPQPPLAEHEVLHAADVGENAASALNLIAIKKCGHRRVLVSNDNLESQVASISSLERLEALEEAVHYDVPQNLPPIDDILYLFVADEMSVVSCAQYRVLALTGHSIAARMMLVSQKGNTKFYGQFVDNKRVLKGL